MKYAFSKQTVKLSDGQRHSYHSMGVMSPYEMLTPIGDVINNPKYIEELLQSLSDVMTGKLESCGWGCDMALVMSYKEKSIVEYMDEQDGAVGDFRIEIPTDWLYKLMTDWKKYLEENL